MAKSADYKLGSFAYPRGWFMIADSSKLGDAPSTLHFFGKDMVFYRGESGQAHLVHAYCPHMGAHLAKNHTSYIVRDGEQVQGESIRCPFHGWRFGPDGQCNDIPYSPNFVPKAAQLKTYTVIERAGIVWMWHDPEGGPPTHELPKFEAWDKQDEGWVRWVVDDYGELPIHQIEIVDNMADYGHMAPIHGSRNCEYFDNSFEGIKIVQRFDAGHRTLTAEGHDVLSLDTWYEGPAILQSEMEGAFPSHMVLTHTPVDDGVIRLWHGLMVKLPNGNPTPEQLEIARAFQIASRDALAQDVEIWANKEPCFNPMQIPADGPYGKVRIWYRQFYNPIEEAAATQKRVEGTVVTFGDKRAGELVDA